MFSIGLSMSANSDPLHPPIFSMEHLYFALALKKKDNCSYLFFAVNLRNMNFSNSGAN